MPKLKVMIDGYNLALEKGTGISTYARNLSYCLSDLGYEVGVLYGRPGSSRSSPLFREVAFFDTPEAEVSWLPRPLRVIADALSPSFRFHGFQVPTTGAVITDNFAARLPHFDSLWNSPHLFRRAHTAFGLFPTLRKVSTDFRPVVMHWTYPLPLRMPGAKNIYTMHDLVPLRLPFTTLDDKRYYLRLCSRIAQSADHIVTVSESSRKDIINLLGVPPDRVSNTYESVRIPPEYRDKPLEDVACEVDGVFGLKLRGYFLFFGAIEPKKNLGRLIEAYLGSGVKSPLVIVGPNAWESGRAIRLPYEENIRSILLKGAHMPDGREIIRIEYVAFPVLVNLIRCAKATLFPSLYEGFGLPVLESMMLGTPVISSNVSSIPEIAGKAAYLVDPYDTVEIANAIREVDTNQSLLFEFAKLGIAQARRFDSEAYQIRLRDVYHRLTDAGSGA